MKTIRWILAVVLACAVTWSGCSRKGEQAQPWEIEGVKVDVPQLDVAFANASQDVQANVAAFKRYFRYGQYPQALAELGKLADQPSLSEPQKKLISDLTEQTKQLLAKTAGTAPGR